MNEHLSPQEAARLLGVSDAHVRRLILRGMLRATRISDRRQRIDPLEVERYARERRPPGRPVSRRYDLPGPKEDP